MFHNHQELFPLWNGAGTMSSPYKTKVMNNLIVNFVFFTKAKITYCEESSCQNLFDHLVKITAR